MDMAILTQYVDAKEASRYLKCAKRTIYGYIERGILPADRVGRAILIPRQALLRFKKPLPGNPQFRQRFSESQS